VGIEENKAIVRRQLEEVFNQKRGSAAVHEFWAEDAVSGSKDLQGLDQISKHIDMMLASFPDWNFTIHDLIAEGDKVVAVLRVNATYQKPFPVLGDIPAVGQPVEREQINIFTVRDGKITHLHSIADNLALQRIAAKGAQAVRP